MSVQGKKTTSPGLLSLTDELKQASSPQEDGDVDTDTGIIGWPYAWQRPAATEEAAWKSMISGSKSQDWTYVGFPWANLIDGLEQKAPIGWKLLRRLEEVRRAVASVTGSQPVATVCQHIHAARFTELFKAMGVSDLFWSHAVKSQPAVDGIKVHGFPLYPAQIGDHAPMPDPHHPRRWLANFIGAYNPKIYLSDVRARIFEDINEPDLLIIKRESWHFDRAVYHEQVEGRPADAARIAIEERQRDEYLEAIRGSIFTLCPTGSGPNSIRIYEALALGSIPIIITKDLKLPGHNGLWNGSCIFETDSGEGYANALRHARTMTRSQIESHRRLGARLYKLIGPGNYGRLISSSMQTESDY